MRKYEVYIVKDPFGGIIGVYGSLKAAEKATLGTVEKHVVQREKAIPGFTEINTPPPVPPPPVVEEMVLLTTCQLCKNDFPQEFGGVLCPKCEDDLYDAREEAYERRNDNNKEPQ